MTIVDITCSSCGRRERQEVWRLAGEDGTFIDPALIPPSPSLCGTCAEEQLRDLLGPEKWARREKLIAVTNAFFATLPAGLSVEERFARYTPICAHKVLVKVRGRRVSERRAAT